MDDPQTLVSTQWVEDHLLSQSLRVLDASWYMPGADRNALEEYQNAHILGASFFDIDLISDTSSDLPHMAPSAAMFAQHAGAMGIQNTTHVVVYDTVGLFSATRVWWLFKMMGHKNVAVMDGGLPKWIAEGRDVTTAQSAPHKATYTATPIAELVKTAADVEHAIAEGTPQILDARSALRFSGKVAEPRAGLRSGHMPGAFNLPFQNVLEADGTMKSNNALKHIFEGVDVDLSKPVITSCGSGVTAAILCLALARIGKTDVGLYDGSWSEWGGLPNSQVV